jgi:hypothetical protein
VPRTSAKADERAPRFARSLAGSEDVDVTARSADVVSSGRDPDLPPRLRGRWWLVAAAIVLIGGGITASVQLAGRAVPHLHSARRPAPPVQVVPAMLHGAPAGRDVVPGTTLLLAGNDLRQLSVTGHAPVSLGWADGLLSLAGRSPLGQNPAVQQIEAVSGGFVALLTNVTESVHSAVGDVFFISVTGQGAATPRLIARASNLAVDPDHRDIWVQQSGPGYPRGATWLIDQSGKRLTPVLRLHSQILLAATIRGLLAGTVQGGARLISTASGTTLSMRMPAAALIAAVSADDVAWQSPSCDLSCPLHVTNLLTGTGFPAGRSRSPPLPTTSAPSVQASPQPIPWTGRMDPCCGLLPTTRRASRLPTGPVPVRCACSGPGPARSTCSPSAAGPRRGGEPVRTGLPFAGKFLEGRKSPGSPDGPRAAVHRDHYSQRLGYFLDRCAPASGTTGVRGDAAIALPRHGDSQGDQLLHLGRQFAAFAHGG